MSKAKWTMLHKWDPETRQRVTIYEPMRPATVKYLKKKGWRVI